MASKNKLKRPIQAKPQKVNLAKQQPVQRVSILGNRTYAAPRPARHVINWTPQLIRAAEQQADAGRFRLMGDLCVDLLNKDDRHDGTLEDVAMGVLTLERSVDADGDGRRKSRIETLTEEDLPDLLPENESVKIISQGVSQGFCLVKLVPWQSSEGGRLVPKLEAVDPRLVEYCFERKVWRVETQEGWIDISPGDGVWALFCPFGDQTPWLRGTWRRCTRWALLKEYAVKDWASQGEAAQGIRTAKTPKQARDPDRKLLAQDLSTIGADAVVVPPAEYELMLVQMAADTHKTYREQVETADKAIAIVNKGESHTTGEGGGGLAEGAGETRKAVSDKRIQFVTLAWMRFLVQIMRPYSFVNFGQGSQVPKICYQLKAEEDLKATVETWNTTGDAIKKLRAEGFNVDREAVAEKIGLPLMEGEPIQEPEPPIQPPTPPNADPNQIQKEPTDNPNINPS